MRDCPRSSNFRTLSAYSPPPLGETVLYNIERLNYTFLIDPSITLLRSFTNGRLDFRLLRYWIWKRQPNLGLLSHQLLPLHHKDNLSSTVPPSRSQLYEILQGAISAALHTLYHSQTTSKFPVWRRRLSVAYHPTESTKLHGSIRPTTLHT
jgi:hypothetical protein